MRIRIRMDVDDIDPIQEVGKDILLVDDYPPDGCQFDYWFPKIKDLDVPYPETELLEWSWENNTLTVSAERIKQVMEDHGWDRAFIRGFYKHAQMKPFEGSFISQRTDEEIERTVQSLVDQLYTMDYPTGDYLILREWIDFEYCPKQRVTNHDHQSEMRFFIDDGDILYYFPTMDEMLSDILDCEKVPESVRDSIQDCSPPIDYAEIIAQRFPNSSWHVDFNLDTSGNWWFIEMAPNGLYWHDDQERWHQIAGHRDGSKYHIERFADDLPDLK